MASINAPIVTTEESAVRRNGVSGQGFLIRRGEAVQRKGFHALDVSITADCKAQSGWTLASGAAIA
jgi:hypothetical protein